MRLLVVVCARPDVVDGVLTRQPNVARLVLGGWVALRVVDPDTGRLLTLDPLPGWVHDESAGHKST